MKPAPREPKKTRTTTKGKRYRCAICRAKSPRPTTAPYYCPKHADHLLNDSTEREQAWQKRDKKTRK